MLRAWLKSLWDREDLKPVQVSWQRVLVLGSANYVLEWWKEHGHRYDGTTVVAINNAWAVPGPERVDVWARSKHFVYLGTLQPPKAVQDKAIRIVSPPQARPGRQGGTMFVSVLWRILDEARRQGVKTTVSVAGSDFDYRGDKTSTHFYGQGVATLRTRGKIWRAGPSWAQGKAADPLRYGLDWLHEKLADVQRAFETDGHRLFNVGDHFPSELPFLRCVPGNEDRASERAAAPPSGPIDLSC